MPGVSRFESILVHAFASHCLCPNDSCFGGQLAMIRGAAAAKLPRTIFREDVVTLDYSMCVVKK